MLGLGEDGESVFADARDVEAHRAASQEQRIRL